MPAMPGCPALLAGHGDATCPRLCDVCKETPIGSALSLVVSIVGVAMVQSSMGSLLENMSFLGQTMEQVENVLGWVMLNFVITLLVNIFALSLATLSSWCVMDWASTRATNSMRYITCLTGRCAFDIAALLVVYTFLAAWALGSVSLVMSFLLMQVALVCRGGQNVIDSASELATKLKNFQTNHSRISPSWIDIDYTGANVVKFCDVSVDVEGSTLVLFIGCSLLTLSQFYMSVNVYSNRGRMLYRRPGSTGEAKDGGCEDSEDSSDEADEEEDEEDSDGPGMQRAYSVRPAMSLLSQDETKRTATDL